MDTSRLSFKADARGYMITYKGQNLGGAGVMNKPKHWRHQQKNIQQFTEHARMEIRDIKAGRVIPRYAEMIEEIDNLSLESLDGKA